jgi:DUF971 family protein
MSHEGIRFMSEEQARKEAAASRELSPQAITPAKVRVHKTEGTGVEIEWKDGHRSQWSFKWLRWACPCATCVEERKVEGRKPGEAKPEPKQLLPMYTPHARPTEVTPVGRYAIRFAWEDGHTSGIYSWDYLRRQCQCENCTATIQ